MQQLVGQIIDGKYQIERLLGSGGMGTVYLATHLGTCRSVAIKVISQSMMERYEYVERFKREAEVVGRLKHPNVVDIIDFGFANTSSGMIAYLVMEFLRGCSLSEVIAAEKKMPLKWSVDVLEQVCAGVDAAHKAGIIHRDLKPDNIWLEPNDRGGYTVKVLDFGIAKLDPSYKPKTTLTDQTLPKETRQDAATLIHDNATESNLPTITDEQSIKKPSSTAGIETFDSEKARLLATNDPLVTRIGAIMGTPTYMSPEQCSSSPPSHLSDIYSLGVIAYEMLSGRPPFKGEPLSILTAHIKSPAPTLRAGGVPRKFRSLIDRSLSKDPIDRPQSAEIFAGQMRSYSDGVGALFRRSLVVMIENFGKLTSFSLLAYFPTIIFALLGLVAATAGFFDVLTGIPATLVNGVIKFFNIISVSFAETMIGAAVIWVIMQYLDLPSRPISVFAAFAAVASKWRQFIWILPLRAAISYILQNDALPVPLPLMFLLSLIETIVFWAVPSIVMFEHYKGLAIIKRNWQLTKRVLGTVIATFILKLLIVSIVTIGVSIVVTVLFNNLAIIIDPGFFDVSEEKRNSLSIAIGLIFTKFTGVFTITFVSVLFAFVYLKTRYAGGESMVTLLEQSRKKTFADTGWQRKLFDTANTQERSGSIK